jgi:hypothetical protein
VKNPPAANDFKKAMGSIVLTAGAMLAEADRASNRSNIPGRSHQQHTLSPAAEFCRLLIAPVEELGPGFAQIPGFPESYCRKHLSRATDFLRQTLATHDPKSNETKRLTHVAGLIEKTLKQYLDEETAIRCWFGDRLP